MDTEIKYCRDQDEYLVNLSTKNCSSWKKANESWPLFNICWIWWNQKVKKVFEMIVLLSVFFDLIAVEVKCFQFIFQTVPKTVDCRPWEVLKVQNLKVPLWILGIVEIKSAIFKQYQEGFNQWWKRRSTLRIRITAKNLILNQTDRYVYNQFSHIMFSIWYN